MDFKNILEYQKKDGELIKIERELSSNPSRKVSSEMIAVVKGAQEKSAMLEIRAAGLERDFQAIKKAYSDTTAQIEKFISKDLESLSQKDLESIISATNAILNNFNVLEKKLFSEAERLNITLNEFENAKKQYGAARAKYNQHKQVYDNLLKEKEPEIKKIKLELESLERGIEPKLLAKYKQLRADKLFPAFVRLVDRSCGGCRMELSAAEIEKVKSNGYLECDNCRRIIISD